VSAEAAAEIEKIVRLLKGLTSSFERLLTLCESAK
jgi:hypothetical protein